MSEQNPEQPTPSPSDSSVADALGIATGAAVVAAVAGGFEAGIDNRADPATLPPNCLNCGAIVRGRYCVDCGQNSNTHVPTLGEVLTDGIADLFNLDSRLWRTLGVLLFRPGLLTRDFIAGRRARYVPPVRLYLVMSVFLFLVLALANLVGNDIDEPEEIDAEVAARVEEETAADLAEGNDAAEEAVDDPDPDADRPGMNFQLDGDGFTFTNEEGDQEGFENGGCERMDIPYWDEGDRVDTAVREACRDAVEDNFASTWDNFRENIPMMAFLVIPLMAGVFKLFYVFTGRPYLAHLVFLCHTHAYTFLMLMTVTMLGMLGDAVESLDTPLGILSGVWILLYSPAYYFMAMRRVYEQGKFLTFVKFSLLMIVYQFVATLVFGLGFVTVMLTG